MVPRDVQNRSTKGVKKKNSPTVDPVMKKQET